MMTIIRVSDTTYSVNVNDVSTAPLSLGGLFKLMRELQIEFTEIETALTELVNNDHKRAHFGTQRKFVYSK